MYIGYEAKYQPDCVPIYGCISAGLSYEFDVRADMCAVLSACTATASNLVSLVTNETGDKVGLFVIGMPTRSYSISGTFTITKE